MRNFLLTSACFAVLAAGVAPVSAAIVISSAPTLHMSCTAKVCRPDMPDAVLNVTQLATMLTSGNVKVTTKGSDGIQANNIQVEAALTWASASVLTLEAHHALLVDQPITAEGTAAGLLIAYRAKDPENLSFGPAGNVTIWDTVTGALTINGQSYKLENSIPGLASDIAGNANPKGLYALVADYDASIDGTYTTAPIPSFAGTFEGLGHTVSNLTINDSTEGNVGLFGQFDPAATVRDVGLVNVSLTATAANVHAGALIGNAYGGTVVGSFSTGSVTGSNGATVGGLVGKAGNILSSYSSATVLANGIGDLFPGGLAGSAAIIIDSHATGSVTGHAGEDNRYIDAGGLAAYAGHVENSYATGNVTTTNRAICGFGTAGGLLGTLVSGGNPSLISRSFATGNVSATCSDVGGLTGDTDGTISDSYSTGSVSGTLGGQENGPVIGGLGGYLSSEFAPHLVARTSYSIGAVSSPDMPQGGFGGQVAGEGAVIDHCYWDTQTSGQEQAIGTGSYSGTITGETTRQLKAKLPDGFDNKIWVRDRTGVINNGFPYLRKNPPPQ